MDAAHSLHNRSIPSRWKRRDNRRLRRIGGRGPAVPDGRDLIGCNNSPELGGLPIVVGPDEVVGIVEFKLRITQRARETK